MCILIKNIRDEVSVEGNNDYVNCVTYTDELVKLSNSVMSTRIHITLRDN